MKRIVAIVLVLCMCVVVCGCGDDETNSIETATEPTVIEAPKLTEKEEQLVNYLITITTHDFYEPSAVRVLEIGDHEDNTMWRDEGQDENLWEFYGPETIVLRLQGENKVGGTLNHCYRICLTSANNEDPHSKFNNDNTVLRYKGNAGQYAALSDSYEITQDASSEYDIGRINNALKEHWEKLGF